MDFDIRKVECRDLLEINQIEKEIFDYPWSYESLSSTYNQNFNDGWVALNEGKIIGYLWYNLIMGESELFRIGVKKSKQGYGVGGALLKVYLQTLKDCCDKIFLEVSEKNKKAILLYEKNYFTCYLRREKYYPDGSDALLYVKEKHEEY